jgi:FMN phosphatase YigB (HAD superfamily)
MYATSKKIIILLITLTTLTTNTRWFFIKKRAQTPTRTTQINQNIKQAIVFDLINVLFKENYAGFAQHIGYSVLASYALTHWKNPGHRCLDMLQAISNNPAQKPHIQILLNERIMPLCIVELQEGKKTCQETHEQITNAIENLDKTKFFSSEKEKKLMAAIMNLMLNPEMVPHITEPIRPMIDLAQKLKNNGHKIYLFANVPHEFYDALEKKHPEVIALFDGVTISCKAKIAKPDKALFDHFITTHKLNPQECILIDTLKSAADMAKTLNMQTIIYDKPSNIVQQLKKYGVIIQ